MKAYQLKTKEGAHLPILGVCEKTIKQAIVRHFLSLCLFTEVLEEVSVSLENRVAILFTKDEIFLTKYKTTLEIIEVEILTT